MAQVAMDSPPGQIGGFPHQECLFGILGSLAEEEAFAADSCAKIPMCQHLLHTAPMERGEEEETFQDLWLKVQCGCHCGQGFSSLKALRMHQMVTHSWRTPMSGYVHVATCPVCLKHFWTRNHLRMHLRYVSRKGTANICAAWLQAFGVNEEARDDLPADSFVALTGACRVEAVQLCGLRVFGAACDDVTTLEQDFLALKDELEESEVSFHPDPEFLKAIGEECAQAATAGVAVQSFYQQWEDVDMGILLGMIFLWGMQTTLDEKGMHWWRTCLTSEPQGGTLVQLHDWAVMIQRAWQVHTAVPAALSRPTERFGWFASCPDPLFARKWQHPRVIWSFGAVQSESSAMLCCSEVLGLI